MKVDFICLGPIANLRSCERVKKHDPKHIVLTVKCGGKNANCWSCLSSSGVGNFVFIDRSIKGEICLDSLQKKIIQICKKFELGLSEWVMQHDNESKHRAHTVTK